MSLKFSLLNRLIEDSFDQLRHSTVAAFPDTRSRQHLENTVNVKSTKFIKLGGSMLEVRSQTVTAGSGNRHKQNIIFNDVDFNGEHPIMTAAGEVHISPIPASSANMRVKCDCGDYYWRFATWNQGVKSLYGRPPPPYVKTTNRPPVNPTSSPGICKHVLAVVDRLRQEGILS